MPRRRRDFPVDVPSADERTRQELRELGRRAFWPYKADCATAGTSSPEMVDDSPYSLRRAEIQDEFRRQREHLQTRGVPPEEQVAHLTGWLDIAIDDAVSIYEART